MPHPLPDEADAKGVKDQGGVVDHLLTDVEVRCLPRYLPEYLELDVTALELNQIYHLSDIKLPEGVPLVALAARPRPAGRRGEPAARRGNRRAGRRRPRCPRAKCRRTAQAEPSEGRRRRQRGKAEDKGKARSAKKADKEEKG